MAGARLRRDRAHSRVARVLLIGISLAFLAVILIVPVISVLGYAFSRGLDVYLGFQKIFRSHSGYQAGLSVTYVRLP